MGCQQIKEERETDNYNNRIKQNLNYMESETTDTISNGGEHKTRNNNSFKKDVREIKATNLETVEKWKKLLIEKSRKHKHDRNKSEFGRLKIL